MKNLKSIYLFLGVEKMASQFSKDDDLVNLKRIRRLIRLLRLEAIYSKPRLPGVGHQTYP